MVTVIQQQLSNSPKSLPSRSGNIKSITELNEKSRQTAESIITPLRGLSSHVIDVEMRSDYINAIKDNALALQKVLVTLRAAVESLSEDFAKVSSEHRNDKPKGSRATWGSGMKAILKLPRRRERVSRNKGHLSDSDETLNGDTEEEGSMEKLPYPEFVDAVAHSDARPNMSNFWNTIAVDISQLIEWVDLKFGDQPGQSLPNPQTYALSTPFPREKVEALSSQLREYLDISQAVI